MKTQIALIKTVLIAGSLFSSLLASSNTNPTSGKGSAETEKTIRTYFKFPQVLMPHIESKNQASKVEVLFTTGRNGKVNFVLAKTPNQKLKEEIEKQFSTLHLGNIKHDVVHSVILNFKTL
jgi:hypothetical protein